MNAQSLMSKIKPIIIIILLFSLAFSLRAQASDINAVPSEMQDFYRDASGLPYFSEMDSYYNYRLTNNYLEKGILGDTIINDTVWDEHSYYPYGRSAEYEPLIAYITTAFYHIANLFGDIPLKNVAFWTGAIIASLSVIPAYLLGRRITNDYGGITSAIIIATAPTYFAHTFAGFFDTDMFNMILPLIAVWFFIESIITNDIKKTVIFAVLSAASLAIFSMAWSGYVFYAALIAAIGVIYAIVNIIYNKTIENKKYSTNILELLTEHKEILSLVIILGLGSLYMIITKGVESIPNTIISFIGVSNIQALAQAADAFPNVFISVSEMQIPSFITSGISAIIANQGSLVGGVGGLFVFIAGILGVGMLIWKIIKPSKTKVEFAAEDRKTKTGKQKTAGKGKNLDTHTQTSKLSGQEIRHTTKNNLFYCTMLVIWIAITIYTSFKGSRFIPTLLLPISISAGVFIGLLGDYFKETNLNDETQYLISFIAGSIMVYPIITLLNYSVIVAFIGGAIATVIISLIKNAKYRKPILTLLILVAIVVPSVCGAAAVAYGVAPGTDDGMWQSMEWINKNTPNDTVIMSWWDFGYMFEVAADRPVSFDGGSQNNQRAYWMGKALSTSDEKLSLGIFNMLSTSGNSATDTLINYTGNTSKSVNILLKTLPMEKKDAKKALTSKYSLNEEQAKTIVNYTHPNNPRPFVLVLSSDMLGKAGWWSYFGSWNFDTQNATPGSYYLSKNSTKPQKTKNGTNIETVNAELQGGYIGTRITENASTKEGVNATIISKAYNQSLSTKNETITPHKLTFVEGVMLKINEIRDNDSKLSLLAIGENSSYVTVIMDKQMEDSMFTKLFLLGGFNQTSFKYLHQEPGVMLWTSADSKINMTEDTKNKNTNSTKSSEKTNKSK